VEDPVKDLVAAQEADQDVPALVSLGDADVPLCEDGSCAL
jgi:hypothetical protein